MARFRRRQAAARKPRRPRDSRTVIVGDETDQDNGILYHCWWCGFTCNDSRDIEGGDDTPNQISYQDFTMPALGGEPGVYGLTLGQDGSSEYRGGGLPSTNLMLSGINLTDKIPLIRIGSDGEPQTVVHNFTATPSGGCPFCGSKNYKGNY